MRARPTATLIILASMAACGTAATGEPASTGDAKPLAVVSDAYPSVSPDGKRVAFHSNRNGTPQVYVMNVDGNGLLKLTGRLKELFKTSKGKYVAPAPIENMLNAHPMVELSLVSGVGHPDAYAMVVLAEALRPQLKDPAVRAQVEAELKQLRDDINRQVSDYEQLRMIVVAPEPWSIENGLLTPTMKIRRARIEKAVEPDVEGWYTGGKTSPVVWA